MTRDSDVAQFDAAHSVIGSMLIDPRCVPVVMALTTEDDIYSAECLTVYKAIRELWTQGSAVDVVIVRDKLGEAYSQLLADMMCVTPTAANVETYCELARQQARLRKLSGYADKLAYARDLDTAREIVERCAELLTDRTSSRVKSYADIIDDYIDRQSDGTPPDYLKWGISQLDKVLSISPGRFVILGADSSYGKTALALQFARQMALDGHKVGFFSLETSHADAGDRLLANGADVELTRSKHKSLDPADIDRIYAEGDRAGKITLDIIEAAGSSVETIRSETLARRYDVIYIDYLQIIRSERVERWQAVTEVSMALHTMAQQLGVTIIALSQVTPPESDKKGARRALSKNDLRESRQLINDADAILMLDLLDVKDIRGARVLIVDKNKDGQLGRVCLGFDPLHMRFEYQPPPAGEQYRRYNEEMARRKRGSASQQSIFSDVPDAGEPLPF